jgi:hypothetical protein
MSDPIGFWIDLVSSVLSVVCSSFALYHLLFIRALRRALNNHVIIVLLSVGLTRSVSRLPSGIYQFFYGVPLIQTYTFYLFLFFLDYALYVLQIILVVWASIERHILIFHDQWLTTRKKRFYIHYLPIFSTLFYGVVFYCIVIFGSFCTNSFTPYLSEDFFIPCTFDKTILAIWDLIVHITISNVIIASTSVALIIRVLNQKRTLNRPIHWRKHRKMVIQLLSISLLYLLCNTPWASIALAIQFGLPFNSAQLPLSYMFLLRSYTIYLFPFVCCLSLSELRNKLKQIVFYDGCRQQRRVLPHA